MLINKYIFYLNGQVAKTFIITEAREEGWHHHLPTNINQKYSIAKHPGMNTVQLWLSIKWLRNNTSETWKNSNTKHRKQCQMAPAINIWEKTGDYIDPENRQTRPEVYGNTSKEWIAFLSEPEALYTLSNLYTRSVWSLTDKTWGFSQYEPPCGNESPRKWNYICSIRIEPTMKEVTLYKFWWL